MRWHVFGMLGLALFALSTGGCGKGEEGVKVTGTVMKGDKPLEGVLVSFCPAETKQTGKGARTDASGKFQLYVKPGKYVVTFSRKVDKKGNLLKESENPTEDATQLEASGRAFEAIPEKFREPTSSPLGVEVPSAGTDFPPWDVAK